MPPNPPSSVTYSGFQEYHNKYFSMKLICDMSQPQTEHLVDREYI